MIIQRLAFSYTRAVKFSAKSPAYNKDIDFPLLLFSTKERKTGQCFLTTNQLQTSNINMTNIKLTWARFTTHNRSAYNVY